MMIGWLASLVVVVMAFPGLPGDVPVSSGSVRQSVPVPAPSFLEVQRMDWFETSWVSEPSALDARFAFVAPPAAAVPPLPEDSGSGKRIVYSNGQQRVWLVDARERIVDSYLIAGRKGVPGPGTYSVFSKSPKAYALHGGITMNWMVRFTKTKITNIGFHDIPMYPGGRPMMTEDQFGQYLSGGCVRQPNDKAKLLYEWAPLGTTVVVTP